jgi:hypothetical protein
MKKWTYLLSTNVIWASFDGGEVLAHNHIEAKIKAKAKLQEELAKVNAALEANPETAGMDIDMNFDEIEIELVKSYNHAMNFSFTVLSDSETAPNQREIRKGLEAAMITLKDDPIELLQRTEIHDTFEIE